MAAYTAFLGVEIHGDAPVFRNRTGHAYSKDTLGDDFRVARAAEFGRGEKRQMIDFRRSGAVEGIVGDASKEHLGHAMGNTIATSNALFETYVPVNVVSLENVGEARKRSRRKMRGSDAGQLKLFE